MTPLYDAIRAFSAQGPVRLHIPGHKGKPLPIPELTGAASLDVTELGPTGDLFHGGEPFDSAQRLWAEDFSMDCCQFLTGGSTLGSTPRWPSAAAPGTGCSSTGGATGRCTTPWPCWTWSRSTSHGPGGRRSG